MEQLRDGIYQRTTPQSNSLKDDKNEFLEEAAKSTECQRDESSSDSDSENDYEFVGNVL